MQNGAVKPLTYTVVAAQQLLSVSERTIYKMMHEGTLRRVKVGRRTLISAADIDAVVAGGQ